MVNKKQLEAKLAELKSDYMRIQEDLEKLVFVGGTEDSAEEQLIRIEAEVAKTNKELEQIDDQ